ncbi:DUF5709 domain-containing protein [Streptomyces sp. NPDC057702]|uniref:DUF5709 domain-containing protein n=1 Tax=unclassified Streptomyces TaxID=2593676 RepID=UPI0036A8625F
MSDDMADDVHQPTGGNEEQGDAAPLDAQNSLDERSYDEILDEGYSPPEKPLGVTRTGTTAEEQQHGESLDERLRQEAPDVGVPEGDGRGDLSGGDGELIDDEVGDGRAGRLLAPDEGAHPDRTKDLFARDVGVDGGAAGPEEAAVHLVEPEEYADEEPDAAGPGDR